MLKHVTLALNTLEPDSWTRHEVPDLCEFLQEQFGSRFPDTARIYHQQVAQDHDVTPSDGIGIQSLQELSGPFYVMVYPGQAALPYIISLVLAVASYALAPSPKSVAPVVAQRNTTATSPNNELSSRSNRARPNARIPDIYGTVRSTPDLITNAYSVFESGREVEYAYMAVTRGAVDVTQLISGQYDVRDGETLVRNVSGATVQVYAPFTSPNSGDAPQLTIGSAITKPVLDVRRNNSVNGQVLRPPNTATFTGSYNVRFVWPNIVELSYADGSTFDGMFVDGDTVTLTDADFSASSTTERYHSSVWAEFNGNHENTIGIDFVGDPNPNLVAGTSITITDLSSGASPIYESTLDLSGTYTVDSVQIIPQEYEGTTVNTAYITLVNPAGVNADWNGIDLLTQNFVWKFLEVEVATTILAFDLNGTYDIVTVSGKQLVLDDPLSVAADWANIESPGVSPYISPTITSAEAQKWHGPFVLENTELTSIYANFVALNGLYRDDGTAQVALSVDIQLELVPLNSEDEPTGSPEYFFLTLSGSSTLKETVAKTLIATPTFSGRCRVRASRVTEHDTESSGTVIDEVKWRDVYSVAPVDDDNFGNVTTVYSKTYATASSLAIKERRLNMEVTRKLPARVGSTSEFTDELYATSNAADIFCAICLDPYIGRRQIAELDVSNIYDTIGEVEDYFGTVRATEFNYTFDSDNMSFEETAQAIAGAVFCTAFRRGNVIKWNFERATDSSTLLFNHRNKLPGSETRTIRFGRNKPNDGVEYSYVSPDDDALVSIFLPENFAAANPKKIESIGVRSHVQAYFHAWRAWNRLRYQHTATEFDATQEADLLVRNDRILVTDGTRPYTRDGEVVAVDGLELTLSQPVNDTYDLTTEEGEELTDETGDTLTTEAGDMVIWLQHTDGIAESIPITMGSDQYHVILDDAPRLPLVTDKAMSARTGYIIVAQDVSHEMAFLVEEKSAAESMTSTVRAINYDARYYEHDTDYINELITLDGYGPRGGHVTITDPEQGPGSV